MNGDPCILIIVYEKDLIVVGIYINNLLLRSKSHITLEWLKDQLIKKFKIKDLGKIKKIIRWEIIRDMEVEMLKIDQKEYIWDLLEVEIITLCHAIILPIKARLFISID